MSARHHPDVAAVSSAVKKTILSAALSSTWTYNALTGHRSSTRTISRLHVQVDWGHEDVKTKMVYTHVLNREPRGVRSPMDKMPDG